MMIEFLLAIYVLLFGIIAAINGVKMPSIHLNMKAPIDKYRQYRDNRPPTYSSKHRRTR